MKTSPPEVTKIKIIKSEGITLHYFYPCDTAKSNTTSGVHTHAETLSNGKVSHMHVDNQKAGKLIM